MLTCDQALERLALLTDADPAGVDAELVQHIETCATCVTELAAQRVIRRVLATRPEDDLPEGATDRLSERIAEIERAKRSQQG